MTGETFAISRAVLRVGAAEEALFFYRDLLGFNAQVLSPGEDTAAAADGAEPEQVIALSAGDGEPPFLFLHANPSYQPRPPRTTGLYHLAVLLPGRISLGHLLRRLLTFRYPLQGASDHHVSEAVYLADPHGNGLELYADRPPSRWRRQGEMVHMTTQPLDIDDLLRQAAAAGDPGDDWRMPGGTRIGHIHMSVADLDRAETFYHRGLGLAVTLRHYPGARFFAADGYHHHVGTNIWAMVDRGPTPDDAFGLGSTTFAMTASGMKEAAARLEKLGFPVTPRNSGWAVRDWDGNRFYLQPLQR
ncbi:MAG TPA: VOC family protein [Sphingobacteriaceae bacterium]|nr:VOC family protein [Sphingobacteriaceae bacterium]